MAVHSGWGIRFSNSTGGSYVQLTECSFLDASGAALAVGGAAGASSIYSPSYAAVNAFDANSGTDWCSLTFPAILWYQMPTPAEVRRVKIRWSTNINWIPSTLTDILLVFSDDGVNWSGLRRYQLSIESGTLSPNTETVFLATPLPDPLVIVGEDYPRIALRGVLPPSVLTHKLEPSLFKFVDVENGGNARIYGTTKVKSGNGKEPLRSRVHLLRQIDKLLIQSVWSDVVTGAFEFRGLSPNQKYLVLAEDGAGSFRPVAASQLVGEVLL